VRKYNEPSCFLDERGDLDCFEMLVSRGDIHDISTVQAVSDNDGAAEIRLVITVRRSRRQGILSCPPTSGIEDRGVENEGFETFLRKPAGDFPGKKGRQVTVIAEFAPVKFDAYLRTFAKGFFQIT